jgi:hypothetical protein
MQMDKTMVMVTRRQKERNGFENKDVLFLRIFENNVKTMPRFKPAKPVF